MHYASELLKKRRAFLEQATAADDCKCNGTTEALPYPKARVGTG
jgi:hypothetical protein